MALTGVCCFDLSDELSSTRGYRLIVPDWSRFSRDYQGQQERLQGEHEALMATLERYRDASGLEADPPGLWRLPLERLIDGDFAIPEFITRH
jgi:Lon protease-like protein